MGGEILGILASIATVVSGLGWVLDRNSKKFQEIQGKSNDAVAAMMDKVGKLDDTIVEVRLQLPEKYVTKDELITHIRGEEKWHESVDRRLSEIREELLSLRERMHR